MELLDREFKITMINMLNALMEKKNMEEQRGGLSRQLET